MKGAEILRKSVFGIVVASVWGVSAASATTIVLDQEFFPDAFPEFGQFTFTDGSIGVAQTFTVGQAGLLDSVEIHGNLNTPSELRILQTSGGAPVGGAAGSVVLASSTSATIVSDGWPDLGADRVYRFDFSAAGLAVNIGDILALQPIADAASGGIHMFGHLESVAAYAGGDAYYFNTNESVNDWATFSEASDFDFRTYVTVPEPATVGLLAMGCVALLRRKRECC